AGQLQMKRLFCLAFGIGRAVAPVEKDDLFEQQESARVTPGQSFSNLRGRHPRFWGSLDVGEHSSCAVENLLDVARQRVVGEMALNGTYQLLAKLALKPTESILQ